MRHDRGSFLIKSNLGYDSVVKLLGHRLGQGKGSVRGCENPFQC
jgi:hypothetical protein